MVLEKIQKYNILQKIWIFIIGKETPNLVTRVSVAVALFAWLYFFSWHLITFLTISLMGTLDNAQLLEIAFAKVGGQYSTYIFGNVTSYLLVHSLVQMIICGVSLSGLVLIWRKKKAGFLLYVFSNIAVYPVTFLIMGARYMYNELSIFDFFLLLALTLYFLAGYWLFYRKR
jgi:hypothetical protein